MSFTKTYLLLIFSVIASVSSAQMMEVEQKEVCNGLSLGQGNARLAGLLRTEANSITDPTGKLLFLQDLSVSGQVRFVSFYRSMDKYYTDMESDDKNLAFISYPNVDLSGNNNRIQPLIELEIEGRPSANSIFKIGYSFSHAFFGLGSDTSRALTVRELLRFEGITNTKVGTFKLTAGGGVNWVAMSPFTLSRRQYRDEPFEKLPWDWYTDAGKKYNSFYKRTSIRTDERYNHSATQGFILQGSDLPGNFGFTLFYGKSARNVNTSVVDQPFNLFAGRVNRDFGRHNFGINTYHYFGDTDKINRIPDRRTILTADARLDLAGLRVYTELGAGRLENPAVGTQWGEAVNVKFNFEKSITKVPLELQFYSLDKNVVSIEGAAVNTNYDAPSGGHNRNKEFDGNLFINVLTEVDMMSNNRQGAMLRIDEMFGKLKVEFAASASWEKENLYDTIMFQHRVNAFTRSRFTPFNNNAGPYQRIRNRFRRSYETLSITDTVSDYKKGFNIIDLSLKYKLNVFGKGLILVNYNSLGSIREGVAPMPGLSASNDVFIRTFYEEFSAYYMIHDKIVLLGFVSYEKADANDRTNLSLENGKPLDQHGYGYGFGIDYDFGKNIGLFLRHRWMYHKDKNFVLDEFKGQETTVELKLFF